MSVNPYTATHIPERYDCKVGDIIGGKYCVKSVLGEGSFGYVYKVSDLSGRVWALKLLRRWEVPATIRQPLIERFDMEYRTGRISSRNLVHSADSGFLKGNPYIVMEFCDGGDLSKFIGKADAPLPRLALEILNGLNDLHKNGKVHRDLKPENVLLKHDGTAVLTDFGISGDRNKRMTERNIFGKPYQIFGTYAYMPPEQVNRARGISTVLPTTDIFSFGVMIYQLLTGELPFGPLNDENDLVRYQKRGKTGEWSHSLLLGVPHGRDWERLIVGCLQPDLKNRIQTCTEAMSLVPRYGQMELPRQHAAPAAQPVQPAPAPAPAPQKTGTYLRIMQGLDHGVVYDLPSLLEGGARRILTFGRDGSNSVPLRDYEESHLSRFHFTLERKTDGTWLVRDGQWHSEEGEWVNSTNGTWINSTEVDQAGKILSNGDILTVGDIKLRFDTI